MRERIALTNTEQGLEGRHSRGEKFPGCVRMETQGHSFMYDNVIEQSVGRVRGVAPFDRTQDQIACRQANDTENIIEPLLVLFNRIVVSTVRSAGFTIKFGTSWMGPGTAVAGVLSSGSLTWTLWVDVQLNTSE